MTPRDATIRMSCVVQRSQRLERSAAQSTIPIPMMQTAQVPQKKNAFHANDSLTVELPSRAVPISCLRDTRRQQQRVVVGTDDMGSMAALLFKNSAWAVGNSRQPDFIGCSPGAALGLRR